MCSVDFDPAESAIAVSVSSEAKPLVLRVPAPAAAAAASELNPRANEAMSATRRTWLRRLRRAAPRVEHNEFALDELPREQYESAPRRTEVFARRAAAAAARAAQPHRGAG